MTPRTWALAAVLLIIFLGCARKEAPEEPGPPEPAVETKPEEKPEPPPPPFRVEREEHEGLDVVTIENARIRVTFLPSVGGRLWRYALKRTGVNQLWNNPDFPQPEDVETWHPYGGLDDHLDLRGGLDGPRKLPMQPYSCEVAESADNVTVKLTFENASIRLVRTHVIYPDSTRLHTREVVTNLEDSARELVPGPHPVFAVGGDATGDDYMIQPVAGAAIVHRYAEPFNRDITLSTHGNWAGAVDLAKSEAVILTFDRKEVGEVNLWFAESSYNIEPMCTPRLVEGGESFAMSFDMFILSGDLADEARALPVEEETAEEIAVVMDAFAEHKDVIAQIERDDFYLAPWGYYRLKLPPALTVDDEPLWLEVEAGSFTGDPGRINAKLTVIRTSDGAGMTPPNPWISAGEMKLDLEKNAWVYVPGKVHKSWRFPVETADLADGSCELNISVGTVQDRGGITHDVIVARGLRDKIDASRGKEKSKFKPKYAGAKFYLGAAERAGRAATGNVPARKVVYDEIGTLLARAREYLAGKVAEPVTGMFARFYASDIDDSVQGYHVHLPEGYTPKKKWPLVVHLHGRGTGRYPFSPERGDARFDALVAHSKVILVRPHGRGNTGYRGAGADDVFRVLEIVRKDYSVDADRIYLVGQSMGGGGTWRLATRYPEVFAAVAPIYGGASHWLRDVDRKDLTPWRARRFDVDSPAAWLENLDRTPVYIYHGVKDVTVDVKHSRLMAKRLKELGHGNFVYEEDPEGIHVIPRGLLERIGDFFLKHKLARKPKHVRLKTPHLRFAKNRWVSVDAFKEPMKFIEIDVKIEGDTVRVDAKNVLGFTLVLDKDLINLKKPVAVSIADGTTFVIERPKSRATSFHLAPDPKTIKRRWVRKKAPASKKGALVKNAQVEGPISDVFRSRFIFVVGTAGNDRWDRACREAADLFNRERWRRIQHVDCIIRTDAELTVADRKNANLILLGGPDVNTVTKQIVSGLPVKFARDGGFTVDGKTFKQSNAALAVCYPSSKNIRRCVVLLAANEPDAMKSIFEWRNISRFFDLDYSVFLTDGDENDRPLLCGIFDRNWKFHKRTQWTAEKKSEARMTK